RKMLQHKGVVRKRIASYLENRGKKGILLKDVDREVVSGLFDFMRNEYRNPRQIKTDGGKLADYTLLLFEETVKAIFNKAMRSDLIAANPIHDLTKGERFHAPDKHREFLTPEELTRFLNVETATGNERQVQLAFGLSSMTGLRLGDMQHLRWSDIKDIDGTPTICITQRKTKRVVSIPLNDLAQSLLPPRDESNPDALVYHLVKKSDNISKYVRRIKDKAGIEKDFTYHSSRHTTATLAITAGADISAVKEMLGHGSVTSTEVYAKVSLDKKIQAVSLTDGVFG
ncbi:MAG: site-specific integrase, partial [Prevotella sp.]|nr:site-specific integrase [Prevotella sp.]